MDRWPAERGRTRASVRPGVLSVDVMSPPGCFGRLEKELRKGSVLARTCSTRGLAAVQCVGWISLRSLLRRCDAVAFLEMRSGMTMTRGWPLRLSSRRHCAFIRVSRLTRTRKVYTGPHALGGRNPERRSLRACIVLELARGFRVGFHSVAFCFHSEQ